MKCIRPFAPWCALSFALVAACTPPVDNGTDGGPHDSEVSAEALAEEYARIIVLCLEAQQGVLAAIHPAVFDAVYDEAAVAASFRGMFQRAIDDPAIEIDEAAYQTCLSTLQAITTCPENAFGENSPFTGCNDIAKGTLEEGATCIEGQCRPDLYCEVPGDAADDCGTCQPLGKLGEDCADRPCVSGLTCAESANGSSYTCEEPEETPPPEVAEVGDPCEVDQDCTPGLVCDGTDGTCQEAQIVDVGGTCDRIEYGAPGGVRFCRDGGLYGTKTYCDIPNGETEGTCRDAPGIGEPCASSGFFQYCDRFESYCSDNTCVAAGAEGDTCTSSSECGAAFNCNDAGVCAGFFEPEEAPMCEAI